MKAFGPISDISLSKLKEHRRQALGSLVCMLFVLFGMLGCTSYTAPPAAGILTISTSSIPNGEYGVAYSATLAIKGGTAPYTWTVKSGALPSGITLSNGGVLSGTPTAGGVYTFTLQVADSGQYQQTASVQFSINVAPQLVITTASLPSITADQNYSVQLAANGGSGTDTWSLMSGSSLPTGLSLNSNGMISGKPLSAGTSTFTVQASDSGTPAQTATKSLSIIVLPVPVLNITTTTLPKAAVGSNYSATLLSQGGTVPIMWALATGSTFPVGLVLDSNSGIISGIPTTSGSFSFTVRASDASTPQQTATQTLTVSITAAAPLTITTTSLPTATAGATYSATLSATGGVAPLTWSISSGTLPVGLLLNASSGVISGTPSVSGVSSVTLQVTDAESPAARVSQSYSLTVNPPLGSGANNGEFVGSYAFLFNGFQNGSAAGAVYGTAIVGSVTADGKGNLTGVEDLNSSSGYLSQIPITGQYAIGADNRGTMIVNDGSTLVTYAISAGSISSGVAQKLKFIEFDDTSASSSSGVVGTGVAKLQSAAAFIPGTLKGTFVFGIQGETPCNTCASPALPYGPVVSVGLVTGDGNGNLVGQQDAGAMNTAYSGITLSGSYSNPTTTTGRGTIQLSASGTVYPAAPTNFVYYVVSANELVMMSSSSHATSTLLSGDVQLQQQSSFTNSSPNGVMISYEASANGGDGIAQFPTSANVSLSMLSITGSGTANLTQDINKAGQFTTPTASAVTYSVSTNGRMTVTSGQIFYLYNTTQAFGLDVPLAGFAPGLIQLEPQTAGTTAPYLAGMYTVQTLPSAVPALMTSGIEQLSLNTGGLDPFGVSGNGALTLDTSNQLGSLVTAASSSILYTESGTGRATTALAGSPTITSVIYVISATRAVEISTGAGSSPAIVILEK